MPGVPAEVFTMSGEDQFIIYEDDPAQQANALRYRPYRPDDESNFGCILVFLEQISYPEEEDGKFGIHRFLYCPRLLALPGKILTTP
jgi:hypothetical protein